MKRRMKSAAIEIATSTPNAAAKIEVDLAEPDCPMKREAEAGGEMVQRDQREDAESPENEGVRDAGQRPFADHFGLEQHFPDEIPDALADGSQREIGDPAWRRGSCATTLPKRNQNP